MIPIRLTGYTPRSRTTNGSDKERKRLTKTKKTVSKPNSIILASKQLTKEHSLFSQKWLTKPIR